MDRRQFLATTAAAAAAAGLAASPAPADPAVARPFARLLPGNRVARGFQAVPEGLRFPDVALGDDDGTHRVSEWRGRAVLVPLWAEWCTACLLELPDLFQLALRQRGAALVRPILTASRGSGDAALARSTLRRAGAAGFAPLVELPLKGRVLFETLADKHDGRSKALPCTLAVGPDGRVLARAFGAAFVPPKPTSTPEEVRALAESGRLKTTWAHPDADAFLAALGAGRLNGV